MESCTHFLSLAVNISGRHPSAASTPHRRGSRSLAARSLVPPAAASGPDGAERGRAGAGGGIIAKAAHCVKGGFGVSGTGAAAAPAVRTTSLSLPLSLARYLVAE